MSKLKAKKPTTIEKRLKAFFYGAAGSGKTTAAISFPKVYLIDSERGAENDSYTKLLEKNGGVIYQTSNFDDIYNEVKSLLTEKHEYKTLVIDPITTIYNNMLDEAALKVGTDFGRHYGEAGKQMKRLLNLLARLDMNVIITAHSKNEYGDDMKVIGSTFDGYKKLDYLFDLVLEIQKRGKKRVAVIRKTRIEAFAETDAFDFSYDEVLKRYGSMLEKDAIAEILASPEQQKEFEELVKTFNLPKETVEKWLDKCNADTVAEMPSSAIQKCIDHLKSQVKGA